MLVDDVSLARGAVVGSVRLERLKDAFEALVQVVGELVLLTTRVQ